MIHIIKRYILASAMTAVGAFAFAAAPNENATVREITPYVTNYVHIPGNIVFIDDSRYARLSDDKRTIDIFEAASGKLTETVFDVANTRETVLESIEGFKLSPDRTKIIVWTNSEPVYRRSFTANYYFYDTHSRLLRPVSSEFARIQSPVFSPDSRMIAFVYENNIYLKKLDYNTQVAVTTDGRKGEIINGATDWTYEEEFVTTELMAFSPDNVSLCYIKSDESQVPLYTLPIYAGACNRDERYELYPGQFTYKYPVAGQKNSTVSLHVYEISNRKTKDVEFADKTIEYIPRIDFAPVGDQLLVTTLNREQNRMEIYAVNPKTILSTSVFTEKSDAWIIPGAYEDMRVVDDGFVVMSTRSGWTHLYKYAFNGSLTRTVTQGEFDVKAFYGFDAAGNAYFQAAAPSPLDRTVYRIDPKGIRTALSPEQGSASAIFSPNCSVALLSYSNVDTPPIYTMIDSKGKTLREIMNNSDVPSRYRNLPRKEFVKVPGDDGLEFNAYIIKPSDFNPSKKYPVVVYQYSGPESQMVLNNWSVTWEHYFASKGYVVFCLDGRGTGGRGTAFMFPVYKKLGYYETIDQIAGARWLASQPWVDSSRIGIHGWSYGGYETLMCLQADRTPFSAGVAVAPVTDWRLYDSIYTERYMSTPQQNYDGYRTSAPLNFTSKMRSELLVMTGTADDNVHPENTFEYAAALQFDGALFDMMVFPGKNHSINGCNARAVVYGNMFRWFGKNL